MCIFSWATVTMYIYMVTVACIFIILLISVCTNFSLFSPCTTTLAPHLLFLRCTQKHSHRQINTETHSHTNKPIQTNQQRDRSVLVEFGSWIGRWRSDMGRGSAGEERIWVVEFGSWIGQWRKDLGRRSLVCESAGEERIWVVDRLVKKGLDEEVIWVGSFWEREREREREVICSRKMSKERERESACM